MRSAEQEVTSSSPAGESPVRVAARKPDSRLAAPGERPAPESSAESPARVCRSKPWPDTGSSASRPRLARLAHPRSQYHRQLQRPGREMDLSQDRRGTWPNWPICPTASPDGRRRAMTEQQAVTVLAAATGKPAGYVTVVRFGKDHRAATHAATATGELACGNQPRKDRTITTVSADPADATCRGCRNQIGIDQPADDQGRLRKRTSQRPAFRTLDSKQFRRYAEAASHHCQILRKLVLCSSEYLHRHALTHQSDVDPSMIWRAAAHCHTATNVFMSNVQLSKGCVHQVVLGLLDVARRVPRAVMAVNLARCVFVI
jgi:hypothetical protein